MKKKKRYRQVELFISAEADEQVPAAIAAGAYKFTAGTVQCLDNSKASRTICCCYYGKGGRGRRDGGWRAKVVGNAEIGKSSSK